MSTPKLSATTQEQAVMEVQKISPSGSYVYCFGRDSQGFDVGVYDSETTFKEDVKDGNGKYPRMTERHSVAVINIPAEGETAFEEFQNENILA